MPSGDEKTDPETKDGSPSKEITDVAAEAASLQPTGFTLATTQVKWRLLTVNFRNICIIKVIFIECDREV